MGNQFDRLIAGTALALIVAAPALTDARPRVESALPPPPSLNGERVIRERVQRPLPPPAPAQYEAPQPVAPRETARAAEPPAEPPPAPAPRATGGGFDIKGTINKFFSASDAQIADQLRAIVAAHHFDRRVERVTERRAMQTYYAQRNYAPLWIHDGRLTARAQVVIARLKDAASEGLSAPTIRCRNSKASAPPTRSPMATSG